MSALLLMVHVAARGQVLTTEGNDFWLTFLPNHHFSGHLTLLVSGNRPTTGLVVSTDSTWSQTFSVVPGVVTSVAVPDTFELGDCCSLRNKGLHVTTRESVSLYASNYREASYDITNVLPTATLGQYYMLQTVTASDTSDWATTVGVVATEDSTEVIFNMSWIDEDSVFIPWHPFRVMLNRGETYTFRTYGDLSGSTVWTEDCKRIAVFTGHECAYVPEPCGACDHLVEQMVPTTYWGRKFGVTMTMLRSSDNFKITALYDSTEVRYDDVSFMLNANESRVLSMSRPLYSAGFYLESSKPVSLFVYLKGGYCAGQFGDPAVAIIHPIEQQFSSVTFANSNTGRISNHYVNLVTKQIYSDNIILDGAVVETSNFSPLQGNEEYVYARIQIGHGSHTITSPMGGFVAHTYGLGDVESYAYSVGASLDPINPHSYLNGMPFAMYSEANNSFCLNDVFHFSSEVANEFTTDVVWYFGDGDTATGIAVTHQYQQPGDYNVTVSYSYVDDCLGVISYTHNLPIHVYDQAISVTDTVICGTVCLWNDRLYDSVGRYCVTFESDAICDSVAVLNINAFHIPPYPSISYDYDCEEQRCSLRVSGDGDYWRWSSSPDNPEVHGHEKDTILWVTPNVAREYHLFMANSADSACGNDTSLVIPQIDEFKAVVSAIPPIADMNNSTVILRDLSWGVASRVWYADTSIIGFGQQEVYDYPLNRDSVIITLVTNSIYGCSDTAQAVLRFISEGLYVPNFITPSKGENNHFQVRGTSLLDGEIWIFNRGGQQLWHTNNINDFWDATFEGRDLPSATYVYTIRYRYRHEPNTWLRKTGTVTVIR